MIVSKQLSYIYFAVPKTATHSVREVLRCYRCEGDWEQQRLFVDKNLGAQVSPIEEIAKIKHGHISVQQIRPHISTEQWQESFKFAFVRNPFDRFVSVCFFLNRKNPLFMENPLAWMKSAIAHPRFQQRVLVQPQVVQLQDQHNNLAMDYIGRYESLQESMDYICAKLGKPSIGLKIKNQSKHKSYKEYYDDELKELVSNFYQQDIVAFGYHL